MHDSRERRLQVAIGLNVLIVATQVVAGFAAHSLGLLADAGHNAADVGALVLALIAVRLVRRRPTPTRSFGFHRASILAAQANAAAILAVTLIITIEGIRRLLAPEPVHGGIVIAVAALGAVVNLGAALLLREGHPQVGGEHQHEYQHGHEHGGTGRDLNMSAALLHLLSDAAASIGVVIAGLVILLTGGWYWLDPAVSLAIGALIARQAWVLLRAANEVLLESVPVGFDLDALSSAIRDSDGIDDVHDVHVWSLSSDVRALSAHLVLSGHPTLEEAQATGGVVKAEIARRFHIAHATFELECESCDDIGDGCAITDQGLTTHGARP